MIHSRHLQQCIGLTVGAIVAGLAIRYRNRLRNYFRQNQRQEIDLWIIYSGSQTLSWIQNNILPNLPNKNVALDTTFGIPGKFRSDNILDIAAKTERVMIILGPDITENKWLEYQVRAALKKDPQKLSAYCLVVDENTQHLEAIDICQMQNIIRNQIIRTAFDYDFWVVYSGPKSLEWALNSLMPMAQNFNKRMAIDIECFTPGREHFRNIVETSQKTRQVVIIWDQEETDDTFRYEIEHALMKGPTNVLVCCLGDSQALPYPCLEPIQKVTANIESLEITSNAIKDFLYQ